MLVEDLTALVEQALARNLDVRTALARLELRILMEESLKHYPRMEIDGRPEYVVSPFVNQLKHLPVRLVP